MIVQYEISPYSSQVKRCSNAFVLTITNPTAEVKKPAITVARLNLTTSAQAPLILKPIKILPALTAEEDIPLPMITTPSWPSRDPYINSPPSTVSFILKPDILSPGRKT
ncbi:uncharacterized protein [Fopius arisanus]|uniref:Uncharacterized protein n=1 Tax=Fopius arisanus TaxID=64838 RepID=A0A9R1TRE3_9HYME|nr:PREDICTED: uncharacterized protein LOC105262750 [Fopius arisanus]